jgi:DNA polymerase III delta subunit
LKLNFINFSDPKDYQYFLLIGNEIVLKQEAISSIYLNLKDKGFKEKITLTQDELEQIQEILTKNIGGSLFQENLILHIKHSSGRFPEKIKFILEDKNIFQSANIAIIIESSIEKTPASGSWIKNFDDAGMIINCNKLKSVEEKIWLKRKLNFLPDHLLPVFGGSIYQNNEANL